MSIDNIDKAESYINQAELDKRKADLRKAIKGISNNLKRWIKEDNERLSGGEKSK
jgi:ABC-type transport system involved in cytochrome bd biosynthesis fused ATPase/permease subunit